MFILVKIFKKTLMSKLVKIVEKSRFWWKFMKISILVKIFEKSWFWSTFLEHLDLVNILGNLDLGKKNGLSQNFRKMSI